MKKYSAKFIFLEILVMIAIALVSALVLTLCAKKADLFPLWIIITAWFVFLLFISVGNKVLFPIAFKTMNSNLEKENFVSSHVFINRDAYTCGSILVIDEPGHRIAYVSVHNPFSFQTADVMELADVKSDHDKGPFGGTRYVFFSIYCRTNWITIPTHTTRSYYGTESTQVKKAIAKADLFRDTVLRLQQLILSSGT